MFFRTYINKVLNKCQQHKCFHLIKTNSQNIHCSKIPSVQIPALYTLRNYNKKKQLLLKEQHASSLSSIILKIEQKQNNNNQSSIASSNSNKIRQSFLKKHEQESIKRLSQQYLNEISNMIEISQQPTISSSTSNLNQFDGHQTQSIIMQKTYRKNSKNDTKLKLSNINKMFKKCQQQQSSVMENLKDLNTQSNELEFKETVVGNNGNESPELITGNNSTNDNELM